jgi:hypothetical protein
MFADFWPGSSDADKPAAAASCPAKGGKQPSAGGAALAPLPPEPYLPHDHSQRHSFDIASCPGCCLDLERQQQQEEQEEEQQVEQSGRSSQSSSSSSSSGRSSGSGYAAGRLPDDFV